MRYMKPDGGFFILEMTLFTIKYCMSIKRIILTEIIIYNVGIESSI